MITSIRIWTLILTLAFNRLSSLTTLPTFVSFSLSLPLFSECLQFFFFYLLLLFVTFDTAVRQWDAQAHNQTDTDNHADLATFWILFKLITAINVEYNLSYLINTEKLVGCGDEADHVLFGGKTVSLPCDMALICWIAKILLNAVFGFDFH